MTLRPLQNAIDDFSEGETAICDDAYAAALVTLSVTHTLDATAERKLADTTWKVFINQRKHREPVDAASLASMSIERFLTLCAAP